MKYYRVDYQYRKVMRKNLTDDGWVIVVSDKNYDYIIEEASDEKWAKELATSHLCCNDRICDINITCCERVTRGY